MKGLKAITLALISTTCLGNESNIWTLWLGTALNDPYPQKIAEFNDEPTCRNAMWMINLTGTRMMIEQKSGNIANPKDIPDGGISEESTLYPECFKGTENMKAAESRRYLKLQD
ncbi:hypothetical protein D9M68_767450 [compost metagenome]